MQTICCAFTRFFRHSLADQSHSAAERSALLAGVHVRVLPSDGELHLRGKTLLEAIEEDKANGKIPFFVSLLPFH